MPAGNLVCGMVPSTPAQLADDRRDELLGKGGVGVLSLSTAETEPPHTLPVSYGYDAEEAIFYFRLATGSDRSKGSLVDRPVSFVTYDSDDQGWWSVVAEGSLEDVDDDETTSALEGLDRVHIPLVDIFGVSPREVTFEFVRLRPEQLSGLRESSTKA